VDPDPVSLSSANLELLGTARVADRLLCAPDEVEIEGKDATGSFSRVPWVRFADRRLSPNPMEGWYAVYLFAEDGSEVVLSLIQGTQVWDGVGMRSRPEALTRRRSDWARSQIAPAIAPRDPTRYHD
jgi:MrcB-like, N-terminal domain